MNLFKKHSSNLNNDKVFVYLMFRFINKKYCCWLLVRYNKWHLFVSMMSKKVKISLTNHEKLFKFFDDIINNLFALSHFAIKNGT
jgi:hypothetical protein